MTEPDHIFHAGERAVQERAGVPEAWRRQAARAIRPTMSVQQQAFFESLPMLFLGLQDAQGRPWATTIQLSGGTRATPGTLTAPGRPVFAGPLGLDLRPGARAAVLGLDFATRRRSRMNGSIAASKAGTLAIAVDQSFGNCRKYIRTRDIDRPAPALPAATGRWVAADDVAAQRIIAAADTFFIATGANGGADVSHRGGPAGFLGLNRDGSLSFPDYSGNRFFNTLGNIEASGRAGLLVPDFAGGNAIVLTGRATIDWSPARAAALEAAERVVDIRPEEIWLLRHALPNGALATD